jgi:hypothetical protein
MVSIILGIAAGLVFGRAPKAEMPWGSFIAMLVGLIVIGKPVRFASWLAAFFLTTYAATPSRLELLFRERNFFGIVRVERDLQARSNWLLHGSIEHGMQQMHENRNVRRLPRLYYDPTGPIGQLFMANLRASLTDPVAVIGLGTGSLATYANQGQEITFFEINPAIIRVAEDPDYFTYLSECVGTVRVVTGDARISLARELPERYGVIVVDAFSGDAIPVHLLTRQAIRLYLSKLAKGGVIAFHITNQFLDLEPVLGALAREEGLGGRGRLDRLANFAPEEKRRGKRASHWVLLARSQEDLGAIAGDIRWAPLRTREDVPAWTDDFSNILSVLTWR